MNIFITVLCTKEKTLFVLIGKCLNSFKWSFKPHFVNENFHLYFYNLIILLWYRCRVAIGNSCCGSIIKGSKNTVRIILSNCNVWTGRIGLWLWNQFTFYWIIFDTMNCYNSIDFWYNDWMDNTWIFGYLLPFVWSVFSSSNKSKRCLLSSFPCENPIRSVRFVLSSMALFLPLATFLAQPNEFLKMKYAFW